MNDDKKTLFLLHVGDSASRVSKREFTLRSDGLVEHETDGECRAYEQWEMGLRPHAVVENSVVVYQGGSEINPNGEIDKVYICKQGFVFWTRNVQFYTLMNQMCLSAHARGQSAAREQILSHLVSAVTNLVDG